MRITGIKDRPETAKKLYPYQEEYIKNIFHHLEENEKRENIIFQLPTILQILLHFFQLHLQPSALPHLLFL